MHEIKLRARAKINLTLDVIGKQSNGYHTVCMIMQTLSLYDGIYIKRIDKPVIRIKSNLDWLPTDEKNLAYKGAELLRDTFHIQEGVFIYLDKKIPVAAGLAGGSTDCAAVMVGMNKLFKLGLSKKRLMELSLQLGTDIPYCILQGTALAEGLGEKLTPIANGCPFCYVLLAKPNISISTASVYQALELEKIQKHPNTKEMLFQMQQKDITKMGKLLCNVLETVTIPRHNEIALLKKKMLILGAEGSLMSGSGATVFGLFKEKQKAKEAEYIIKKEFGLRDVFVTEIWNKRKRKHFHK